MEADLTSDDRVRAFDPYPRESRLRRSLGLGFTLVAILGLAAFVGAALFGYKVTAPMWTNGVPAHDYAKLYAKYAVSPIPPGDIDADMDEHLRKLEAETCDWTAMSKLGKALGQADDTRLAATFYLGFARICSRSDHAEREAAGLYYKLSDFALADRYYSDLAARYPQNDLDWYHKGQSEAKLERDDDALQSYATAISLMADKTKIGDWVFYEMAAIYAAQARFCEAMSPIDTYVSLDPARRDTSKTQQVLASYSEKGHCTRYASGRASFPVLDNNVVNVRAAINGVVGTFAIDTGASFVAVTPAFATKAHIETSGAIQTSTANGDIEAKLAKASTVSLGGLKATDVPLVVVSKPIGRIDGLLGRSFLARYDMTIGRHRLTLTSKAP